MAKNEKRLNRVDEELKKELSQIISYELKNPDVFPSQLCFNIVITILGGLCTQRGKKVLDELKDNYN